MAIERYWNHYVCGQRIPWKAFASSASRKLRFLFLIKEEV
jgi:hypothetical protein